MELHIRISIIAGIIFFAAYFIRLVIKNKMNLKYTLIWFLLLFLMIIAVIFDDFVLKIAEFIGFKSPVNFILTLFILFCLLVLVLITAILSHMNNRVFELVQQMAILEKKVRNIEEAQEDK